MLSTLASASHRCRAAGARAMPMSLPSSSPPRLSQLQCWLAMAWVESVRRYARSACNVSSYRVIRANCCTAQVCYSVIGCIVLAGSGVLAIRTCVVCAL